MNNAYQAGLLYELRAARYVRRRGYRLLNIRYRARDGEIDLIARDGDTIVFIEVKARPAGKLGAGVAAVVNALCGEISKGTIAIVRKPTKKYKVDFVARPIAEAAKYTRAVPDEFIAKNGHDVTPAFLAYAKPIVGELPHSELL